MPRTCTVCRHSRRQAIEEAIVVGEPIRAIAGRFGASRQAVSRHQVGHLPSKLLKAAEAREKLGGDDILDQLLTLSHETAEILQEARKTGRHELALRAIARAESQLELQARLLGELKDRDITVNVLALPEWTRLQHRILAALKPHPAARIAVSQALIETSDV